MATLRVHAGSHARLLCPLSVPIPAGLAEPLTLVQRPGARPRYCQTAERRVWWILHRLAAGESVEFQLESGGKRRRQTSRLRWEALGRSRFVLRHGDDAWMGYQFAAEHAFPGLEHLLSPGGELAATSIVITAPLLGQTHARTIPVEPPRIVEGPVWTSLRQHGYWVDDHERRLAEELTTFAVYALPAGRRMLEIFVSLRASFGPIPFDPRQARGLLRLAFDSLANTPWVDAHGARNWQTSQAAWCLRDAPAPLAIVTHPANPGGLAVWRRHDDGTLDVGFLGSWPIPDVRTHPEVLTLPTSRCLTWRYRILLPAHAKAQPTARQVYLDLVEPPLVELVQD